MENSKIDLFMLFNSGNFEEIDLPKIQSRLEALPEESSTTLFSTEFKKPTTALIISFLGGTLGIDRFYLGQTGNGVLKLITCGGFGLWAIIDLFLIMGAAREYNTNKLITVLNLFKKKQEEAAQQETKTTTASEPVQNDNFQAAPNKTTDVTAYMPTSVAFERSATTSDAETVQSSESSIQSVFENQTETTATVEPEQPNVEPEQPIIENAGNEYTKTY